MDRLVTSSRHQDWVRARYSNDYWEKKSENKLNALLGDLSFTPVDRTDDYAEQRGLEQQLHDQYNQPLDKINPISPKNPNYRTCINAANNYNSRTGGP